ncbi:ParB N-terminal domain-containing protein [Marinomonas sp.]|uniref:ParB N-terminal domain-containing protein n=1 Tax=Marinomonas sp. TaxID=1904862 RepID=UPI003BABFAEA
MSIIHFLSLEKLRPTESVAPRRVAKLKKKIQQEGVWTRPICVEENDLFIMDGHHRFAVAKRLGLKLVPVLLLNYETTSVLSRKRKYKVSASFVRSRAKKGFLYPLKNTCHIFPEGLSGCVVPLSKLHCSDISVEH